jgi:hypothetical protein
MKHPTRRGIIIAMMSPVMGLVLFYSLAAHLYFSLGYWPDWNEETGSSPALILHRQIQMWWCAVVGLASVYLWPVAMVVCAAAPKARWVLVYLAIFTLTALACFGLALLAPVRFLDWWQD